MSQEKLAETQGVSFQQLQKYERANNRISASRLYHLSKALAVPVEFFFEDMSGPDASTKPAGLPPGEIYPLDNPEKPSFWPRTTPYKIR
jgi:transcriptional regulator with XRE-family HTH domain